MFGKKLKRYQAECDYGDTLLADAMKSLDAVIIESASKQEIMHEIEEAMAVGLHSLSEMERFEAQTRVNRIIHILF